MRKHIVVSVIVVLIFSNIIFAQTTWPSLENVAPGVKVVDDYTLVGEKSFLTGYEPMNTDGTINVVVEIPAGTTAKWEVMKPEGELKWEFKEGKPRVVKYLGYPGNYGMVPRTLLPEELGGDGDPLDVIILGAAVPRSSVVKAKLVGVLNCWTADSKMANCLPSCQARPSLKSII